MYKIGEFGDLVGASASTLRRWEKEGKLVPTRTLGGQRQYSEHHRIIALQLRGIKPVSRRVIVYCRVSSPAQRDDLQSQKQAMEQFMLARGEVVTDWIEEVGGGLNFKRSKFLQIIRWAIQGEVSTLNIAHKDRLCRFGFDLVEQIVQWGNGSIVVANAESLSPHEEMVQDLLAIVHCFSSRLYGLRKYKKQIREFVEAESN